MTPSKHENMEKEKEVNRPHYYCNTTTHYCDTTTHLENPSEKVYCLTVPFRYANTTQPTVHITVQQGNGGESLLCKKQEEQSDREVKFTTCGGKKRSSNFINTNSSSSRSRSSLAETFLPSSSQFQKTSPKSKMTTNGKRTGQKEFFGFCYLCGHGKHSQNYCPLKLCEVCGKYGHDARVCYFKRSSS